MLAAVAPVRVVCLAGFANLAFSCLLSRSADGRRDHAEHTAGRGGVPRIIMERLVWSTA